VQETHLEAGQVAQDEGAAAVVLHTRYAEQLYAPPAHWQALQELSDAVSIPVIGNGDVYRAADCTQMLQHGARGVMIGRACLGRPWVRAVHAPHAYVRLGCSVVMMSCA
jgi:tRNA-dihydrouridine synthase